MGLILGGVLRIILTIYGICLGVLIVFLVETTGAKGMVLFGCNIWLLLLAILKMFLLLCILK